MQHYSPLLLLHLRPNSLFSSPAVDLKMRGRRSKDVQPRGILPHRLRIDPPCSPFDSGMMRAPSPWRPHGGFLIHVQLYKNDGIDSVPEQIAAARGSETVPDL